MTKQILCPPTPAGLAMGAMLRLFGTAPGRQALEEVFDASFLASAGTDAVTAMFEAVHSPSLTSVDSIGPHELHARLRAETGEVARLRVVVAPAAPHRVTGLIVRPENDAAAGVRFDDLLPAPQTVHASSLSSPALATALTEQLAATVEDKHMTGVALAVVQRGRVALHASCGWAAVSERRPVEARTVFRAYSVTKLVTAMAVLQLWEEQQFDLDDPVNDHLQSLRLDGPGRAITVRDLLCHRSGLGRAGSELMWRTQAARAVDVLGPVVEAPDRPGEVVESDAGYGVLSQLVEDLTGVSFEERVVDNVLAPLGMTSSDMRRSDPPGEQYATGHEVAFGEVIAAPTDVAALLGSGGLFTTAPDLAALALAVIGGGANGAGRVLSPETMALATAPAAAGLAVGFGFHLATIGRDRCVWHRGAGHGFSTMLAILPTKGAAVALLANTGGRTGDAGGLERDAMRMLKEVVSA